MTEVGVVEFVGDSADREGFSLGSRADLQKFLDVRDEGGTR